MARGIQVGTENIGGDEIPVFVEEFKPSLGYFKSNFELFEYYYKIATDPNIDPQILHEYADLCDYESISKEEYESSKGPFRFEVVRLAIRYLGCTDNSKDIVPKEKLKDFLSKYLSFFNYGIPENKWRFSNNTWLFITIAPADLRVMKSLPESELGYLSCMWLMSFYENIIYTLVDLGHDKIVAEVYDLKGIRWFYPNSTMMGGYNYALLAFKCKKKYSNEAEHKKLRNDLYDMISDLKIARTQFEESNDEDKRSIQYIDSSLDEIDEIFTHWNDEQKAHKNEALLEKLINARNENEELLRQLNNSSKTIEKLKKSYEQMENEIKNLQKQKLSDEDLINRIQSNISSANRFNLTNVTLPAGLSDFWKYLLPATQKEIQNSFEMVNELHSAKYSIFALLTVLEREFKSNIFYPFRKTKGYQSVKGTKCNNDKYEVTHKALAKELTMGNIKFLGLSITTPEARRASKLINEFANYLGDKTSEFIKICNDIDKYRIKVNACELKLVDVRNAIAHGNEKVDKYLDEKCFEELLNIYYIPPLKILKRIVFFNKPLNEQSE